ncbi:hypothetical protein GCM10009765_33600 [Fodinicola feengrottensis]|uniref:Uncharacterized protein n=1 Tax=Fodinicola feengrottensis TaxID=435914 RepID=A0ABN2H469_9ACTN
MRDKKRPGPVYDNAIKLLTVPQRAELCRWLGIDVVSEMAEPEDLSGRPLRVDMLARVGSGRLAHIEFFRNADSTIGPRMVEYLARLWQRHPRSRIEQHVVLLGGGRPPEEFVRDDLSHRYRVHLLRECDPEGLLERVATAPLAVLAKAERGGRQKLFRDVLERIQSSGDPETPVLTEMAEILAGVHLSPDVIKAIAEEVRMPFDLREFPPSPRMREAFSEGRIEGAADAEVRIFAILLRMRFGPDSRIEGIARRLAAGDAEAATAAINSAESLDVFAG